MKVWVRGVVVVVMATAAVVVVPSAGPRAAASVAPDPSDVSLVPDLTVWQPTTASPTGSGTWGWPLQPQPTVLARFDPPRVRWASGHRGVDLAASVGEDVLSPVDGVVAWSGTVVNRGVVVIASAAGLRSTVEPVEGFVPVGAAVRRGQPIGSVTASPGHCAPVTCVHWGVLRGSVCLDPLALVGAGHVVLLPLWPP
jgi:murein DD-endopeptidase MepM/ murein hydrolase activator NlpD